MKYCCNYEQDGLKVYAVLDRGERTFKWSLFKDDDMLDCGELSFIAQTNPKVFLDMFTRAVFETYKSITFQPRRLDETV